jgi:curved DNA-binding protein CbpA
MKPFEQQNYYELLEVPVSAPPEEIRAAYSRLMELYAPDSIAVYALVDPEQVDTLRARMTEAMEILTDEDLRAEYDKGLGVPAQRMAEAAGNPRAGAEPRAVVRAAEALASAAEALASAAAEQDVAAVEARAESAGDARPAEGKGTEAPAVASSAAEAPVSRADYRSAFIRGFSFAYVTSSLQDTQVLGSAVYVPAVPGPPEPATASPRAEAAPSASEPVTASPRAEAAPSAPEPATASPRAEAAVSEAVVPSSVDAEAAASTAAGPSVAAAEAPVSKAAGPSSAATRSVTSKAAGPRVAATEAAPPKAAGPRVAATEVAASRPPAEESLQARGTETAAEASAAPAVQAARTPSEAPARAERTPATTSRSPSMPPPLPSQRAAALRGADESQSPPASEPARPAQRPSSGRQLADAQVLAQDSAIATAESALAVVAARVRENQAQPLPQAQPRPKTPDIPADAEFNGELLRRVREARGYSLQQVADRTRISSRHLENVEADQYAALPAPVYLRGILMNLARELGLDPLRVSRSYLALASEKAGKK